MSQVPRNLKENREYFDYCLEYHGHSIYHIMDVGVLVNVYSAGKAWVSQNALVIEIHTGMFHQSSLSGEVSVTYKVYKILERGPEPRSQPQ